MSSSSLSRLFIASSFVLIVAEDSSSHLTMAGIAALLKFCPKLETLKLAIRIHPHFEWHDLFQHTATHAPRLVTFSFWDKDLATTTFPRNGNGNGRRAEMDELLWIVLSGRFAYWAGRRLENEARRAPEWRR